MGVRRRESVEELAAAGRHGDLITLLEPSPGESGGRETGEPDTGRQRRAAAAEHLAAVPGETVTAALVDALGDRAAEVRLAAVRALLLQADQPDAAIVEALVLWPEAEARQAAGEALAERARTDPHASTRMALTYSARQGAVALEDATVVQLVANAGTALPEIARRSLEDPDPAPRAVQVLRASGPAGEDALHSMLGVSGRRPAIARVLARLGGTRGAQTLVGMLASEDPADRSTAALALGEVADRDALEPLLRAGADPDFSVRDAAQRAVERYGRAGLDGALDVATRSDLGSIVALD